MSDSRLIHLLMLSNEYTSSIIIIVWCKNIQEIGWNMYSTWVVLDLNLGVFCPLVVNFRLIKYREYANYVQISANKVQNEVLMVIFLVS